MGKSTIRIATIGTPTMVATDKSSADGKGQQYIEIMGEEFTTSEVMEDDMVSGIEIAPSKSCSESVSTASTDPLTTDSSESWSISSNSLADVGTDSEEDENDQAPFTGRTPLFCNAGSAMENSTDAEGFCGPVYGRRRRKKPIKQRMTSSLPVTRRCDVQEERTRIEMVLVVRLDSLSERGKNNVSLNSEQRGIVDTFENQPDRLFSSLISKTTSLLCKMSLKATDLPFLLNSVTHSASNGFSLQPPFVMFPNKSTVFVAKHKDSDIYQLMSRGPIPVDSLSQLFSMQDRMEGLFVSILAFHDGIPTLVGNDPLALNDNFSILLDDWRRKRKSKKKSGTNTETDKHTPAALKPKRNMQIDVDDECGNFVCNPGLLPLMTSPKTTNDEADLLRDDELRAVMKITQNGNDTSALFPCFSAGSDSYSCESDDGLRDELGALESLQNELQIELQTAEVIIKEQQSTDVIIKELQTAEGTTNGTDDIDIGTGKKFIRKLPSLRRHEYQAPLSTPRLPPPRSRRKVRFSKTHTEHIFISEIPSISDESAEDYGCEFHLDEYTYAIEEAVEGLIPACVKNLHYFKPRPPTERVATRSNMHYF
jgi:hypothetical protein